MKQVFLIAATALVLSACQQNSTKTGTADSTDVSMTSSGNEMDTTVSGAPMSADAAVLTFENISHDFGKIKAGEKVHYDFYFTNTGKPR